MPYYYYSIIKALKLIIPTIVFIHGRKPVRQVRNFFRKYRLSVHQWSNLV